MKKFLAIMLALVMTGMLAACGSKPAETKPTEAAKTEAAKTEAAKAPEKKTICIEG